MENILLSPFLIYEANLWSNVQESFGFHPIQHAGDDVFLSNKV